MKTPNYELIQRNPDQERMIYHVEVYSGQFLNFLPRNIPEYSSHGLDHSMNIIENLNEFIKNWDIDLSENEILLLYLSAWLHDIGCIKDRDKHHEISAELLLNETSLVQDLTEKNAVCLKYIILAHRARYSIESVPEYHEEIRLRMICAIFRLMDACEICQTKCPTAVYEVIKDSLSEEANKFWIGHKNIVGLNFHKPKIEIIVNNFDKCQFIIDDLKREIDTIAETFKENNISVPTVHYW